MQHVTHSLRLIFFVPPANDVFFFLAVAVVSSASSLAILRFKDPAATTGSRVALSEVAISVVEVDSESVCSVLNGCAMAMCNGTE